METGGLPKVPLSLTLNEPTQFISQKLAALPEWGIGFTTRPCSMFKKQGSHTIQCSLLLSEQAVPRLHVGCVFYLALKTHRQDLRLLWGSIFSIFLFNFFSFLFFFFLLDIFLIYISNVFPFPGFPFRKPLIHPSSPCLYKGALLSTHPLLPSRPGIPLHWGIEHPQTQEMLLPLMSNKAILCHICCQSIPPCVLFGLWSSSWELQGVWPVDIVAPPMGLQIPSAPLVPAPTPPLGTLSSVQCLAVSIRLCICQALAEPLRRQPYQAPVSNHFWASTIASRFGVCVWDGSPDGAVSGWPFLQSLLHTLSLYFLL